MTDKLIEFFEWVIAEGKLSYFIFLMFLIALNIIGLLWAIGTVHGQNSTNSTDILCDKIMYSDNWTSVKM
jgi:hypothetical protein